jgi:hypothetical protein
MIKRSLKLNTNARYEHFAPHQTLNHTFSANGTLHSKAPANAHLQKTDQIIASYHPVEIQPETRTYFSHLPVNGSTYTHPTYILLKTTSYP